MVINLSSLTKKNKYELDWGSTLAHHLSKGGLNLERLRLQHIQRFLSGTLPSLPPLFREYDPGSVGCSELSAETC